MKRYILLFLCLFAFTQIAPAQEQGAYVARDIGSMLDTAGAPANGVGKDGDYAFDKATKTIYGPKAAGVWPAGVVLAGSTPDNTAYGVAWDGSALAPNQDRVYDKIEAVVASIPPASHQLTVYAAGTAYTLTSSTAALDFGTTDPVITINQAGTYLMFARVAVNIPTSAGNEQLDFTFKLRRTNNTAADISNSTTNIVNTPDPVRDVGLVVSLPPVIYTTASTTDSITIFGVEAGAVVPSFATEASIIAIRIQ